MNSNDLYHLESQVAMTVFYQLLRNVQNTIEKAIDGKGGDMDVVYAAIEQDVSAIAKEFYNPSNNANFFKNEDDFLLPTQIVKYRVVEHGTASATEALKWHAYNFAKLGVNSK